MYNLLLLTIKKGRLLESRLFRNNESTLMQPCKLTSVRWKNLCILQTDRRPPGHQMNYFSFPLTGTSVYIPGPPQIQMLFYVYDGSERRKNTLHRTRVILSILHWNTLTYYIRVKPFTFHLNCSSYRRCYNFQHYILIVLMSTKILSMSSKVNEKCRREEILLWTPSPPFCKSFEFSKSK